MNKVILLLALAGAITTANVFANMDEDDMTGMDSESRVTYVEEDDED